MNYFLVLFWHYLSILFLIFLLTEAAQYECSYRRTAHHATGVNAAPCVAIGTHVGLPQFNRTSFIAYQSIRDALYSVVVRLVFKATSSDDGLLLYNAYNSSGFGDFIALSLRDRRVVFQFDTGAGTRSDFVSSST